MLGFHVVQAITFIFNLYHFLSFFLFFPFFFGGGGGAYVLRMSLFFLLRMSDF